jgi:hypothetical protein
VKQQIESPKLGPAECLAIHQAAHKAGIEAALKARPAPMAVVGDPNFNGKCNDGGKHVFNAANLCKCGAEYFPPEVTRPGVYAGACGFAWVNIRPGNGRFAKWACAQTEAEWGRPNLKLAGKAYHGGVEIWIGGQIPQSVDHYGQSVDIKYAYAGAYAKVLRDHGIYAHAGSRLD